MIHILILNELLYNYIVPMGQLGLLIIVTINEIFLEIIDLRRLGK
jgi:hypothetical protein